MSTRSIARTSRKDRTCPCGRVIRRGDRYVEHLEFPGGESGYADDAGHPVRLPECAPCAYRAGRAALVGLPTAEQLAAAFNDRHPVGTVVHYWTGARSGPGVRSTTRTEAQVLGGHTAVVWVTGEAACINLSHVQAATRPDTAVIGIYYDLDDAREIEACHFTDDTGRRVWEWCDPSKPIYDAGIDQGVTGLRVQSPWGEQRAVFGDWIAHHGASWWVIPEAEFTTRYVEIGCTALPAAPEPLRFKAPAEVTCG